MADGAGVNGYINLPISGGQRVVAMSLPTASVGNSYCGKEAELLSGLGVLEGARRATGNTPSPLVAANI